MTHQIQHKLGLSFFFFFLKQELGPTSLSLFKPDPFPVSMCHQFLFISGCSSSPSAVVAQGLPAASAGGSVGGAWQAVEVVDAEDAWRQGRASGSWTSQPSAEGKLHRPRLATLAENWGDFAVCFFHYLFSYVRHSSVILQQVPIAPFELQ